jgi:hypothetical protein
MQSNQKYSLVGTWRGSTGQTGMEIYIETTLNEDMTFATTSRSASGIIVTSGPYRLVNENTIEYTNLKKWPDVQTMTGPLIGQPIGPLDFRSVRSTIIAPVNIPDKDSVHFRFVDENTMIVESTFPGIAPVTFRRGEPFSAAANPFGNSPFQSPMPGGFQPPMQGGPFFTPFGANQSMSSEKIGLYIVVAFFLATTFLGLYSMINMR